MLRNHGHRSSSVNGWPDAILATFASGWNASPSANVQPSKVESPLATVLLPTPETPITTTICTRVPPATLDTLLASRHRRRARWEARTLSGVWLVIADARSGLDAAISR